MIKELEEKNKALQRRLIVLEKRNNHLKTEKLIVDNNPSKKTLDGAVEILFYDKVCSKVECDKMRKYFSEKYGI